MLQKYSSWAHLSPLSAERNIFSFQLKLYILKNKSDDTVTPLKENIETPNEDKSDKDGTNMEEEEESLISKDGEISSEPTSWKLLDIKAMKVNELGSELEARSLNAKGLKAQLVARLQEAIQKEQEEEACKSNEKQKEDCEDTVSSDKMDTLEITEKSLDENETKTKNESSTEKIIEEPEVMEIDRKTKSTEKNVSNDDDVFVKPQPAMDDKQKQILTTAYKLPGTNLNCSNRRITYRKIVKLLLSYQNVFI